MAILSPEQPPVLSNYEDAFNSSQASPDILFARGIHLEIFSLIIALLCRLSGGWELSPLLHCASDSFGNLRCTTGACRRDV